MRMRPAAGVLLAIAALGVSACGSSGNADDPLADFASTPEPASTTPAAPATPKPVTGGTSIGKLVISKDLKKKPKIGKPGGTPPTALYSRDIVKGKGKTAKSGDAVTVKYVGVSFSTGEQFDASWDRGQTFPFTLGAGNVIPGWDQGVPGMRVGGRRLLVIPPDLAYGSAGQGSIGPNETLLFVIDLKKIG